MPETAADHAWTGRRPLRDSLLGDLSWRRPGAFSRQLVLEAGSERLALVRWPKWFSFDAEATCADGRWIIGRRRAASLLGEHVVRDADSGAEVASFKRGWSGKGVVRFSSALECHWERVGFWRPRYRWMSAEGRPLVTFRTLLGFGRSYEMTVEPAARALEELPVLVVLGVYVMAMITAQSSAS